MNKKVEFFEIKPMEYHIKSMINFIELDDVFIEDKIFKKYIESNIIQNRVKELSQEIYFHYHQEMPIFLIIMNGSFMFASDLLKQFAKPVQTEFISLASYEGTETTGKVKMINGDLSKLKNKKVLIIEDIIDTGITMNFLIEHLKSENVDYSICSFLNKPEINQYQFDCKTFIGFNINPDFVVGYGLDFNNIGRNLSHLYILKS